MIEFTRKDIQVNQLSNGQPLDLKIFKLKGSTPGFNVHIQSSVHGAELQGNCVIWELLRFLSLDTTTLSGSINFLPMVNPLASNTKAGTSTQGRFNPVTGDNWNRNFIDIVNFNKEVSLFNIEDFWRDNRDNDYFTQVQNFKSMQRSSFEKIQEHLNLYGLSGNTELNLILQKEACLADIVLDLHTGPCATRYLYAGEYLKEKAGDLPFAHTLIIPNEFSGAMDEACFFPWTELTKHVKNLGESFINPIESYTVELGDEEKISFNEAREDAARILLFLARRGLINFNDIQQEYSHEIKKIQKEARYACLLKDYTTYYTNKAGLVEYLKKPGEHVSKNEPLYKILDYSPMKSLGDIKKCISVQNAHKESIVINHCPSASVTKGTLAYQVMENFYHL